MALWGLAAHRVLPVQTRFLAAIYSDRRLIQDLTDQERIFYNPQTLPFRPAKFPKKKPRQLTLYIGVGYNGQSIMPCIQTLSQVHLDIGRVECGPLSDLRDELEDIAGRILLEN